MQWTQHPLAAGTSAVSDWLWVTREPERGDDRVVFLLHDQAPASTGRLGALLACLNKAPAPEPPGSRGHCATILRRSDLSRALARVPEASDLPGLPELFDAIETEFLPAIPPAGPDGTSSRAWPILPEAKVITAVVDTGIAFAHERFRIGPTESRMAAFIDMNRLHPGTTDQPKTFDKPEIDALLRRHHRDGHVNEHALYVEAGLIDYAARDQNPVARAASHGTQVLDAACGYDWRTEAERARRHAIIAVELPQKAVSDTHGHKHDGFLWWAVETILQKAAALSAGRPATVPVILNFSFGNYAGRHDGQGLIERLFDSRIAETKTPDGGLAGVFLAAGNSLQARTHARYRAEELRKPQTLELVVQPDDKGHTFVQIWTAAPDDGRPSPLRLRLAPPAGEPSPAFDGPPPARQDWSAADGTVLARIYHQIDRPRDAGFAGPVPPGSDRLLVTIAIRPSAADDRDRPTAPAGTWRLELGWDGAPGDAAVDLWIERGDTPQGLIPRGRQAYFDHPDYRTFDHRGALLLEDPPTPAGALRPLCPVTRTGTLSAIASGARTVVVGAHRRSDSGATIYSSIGPVAGRSGPDLTAPGDGGWVITGLRFAGNRSGSTARARGTSIAAPLAARAAAEEIIDRPGRAADLRETVLNRAAIDTAREPPPRRPISPHRGQAGRLRTDLGS